MNRQTLSELFQELRTRAEWAIGSEPACRFRCNLCGKGNIAPFSMLDREKPSCRRCGSTLRWRSLMTALSEELFGRRLALPDFPNDRTISGVGLSDAFCYALPLAERLDYSNTFYDREPRLDILDVGEAHAGRYDFVISTDVFEHTAPPAVNAFIGARRLLKPGGVFVFSVPYNNDGETIEHFPELHLYDVAQRDGVWTLDNRTRDGRQQRFTNLVFHEGPGVTLEMRVFSRSGIAACVREAGFGPLRVCDGNVPEFGIIWPPASGSFVMVARA